MTNSLLKSTFFAHFCAGEDEERIAPRIKALQSAGVGSILDYAAEADLSAQAATAVAALGHSTSLYEHDAAGATYECGTQAWYYPFVEAAVATLALVGAGAYTWREQRFGVALGEHYWRRRGRFFADVDLHTAVGNMAALAAGTGAVCAIGVAALLPLYLNITPPAAVPL